MTPARVRACTRLASRARKPGASVSWRSNTLRFTTMIVSIVAGGDWPDRRTGGPAVRSAAAVPTASPPVRQTAAGLFDQVNALVQRIGRVASGVAPFREIQRRVYAARDLAQAPRRQPEGTTHRVGFERVAETGHGGIRGNASVRAPERIRDVLPKIVCTPEVERQRQRVLVPLALRGIEIVAGQPHVTTDRKSTRLNSSHVEISYA